MPQQFRKRTRAANAPASFIDPCLPIEASKPPAGPLWAHEVKHDGFRLQIHVHAGRVRLYTMTGIDWTDRYPLIVDSASRLKGSAIIDAEAVHCDAKGVADFDALYTRADDAAVLAYAFDLMMRDGEDLRNLPWLERRRTLRKLLGRDRAGLRYNANLANDGERIFRQVCKLGLEGIVSKRIDSRYKSGNCKAWIKTKNPKAPAKLRFEQP